MRQELVENAETILNLRCHFESIRREVLARYRPKLGALTVDQEQALKALTRSLVNKIVDLPISEIRREAEARNGSRGRCEGTLISAVQQIFRLSDIHAEEYQ